LADKSVKYQSGTTVAETTHGSGSELKCLFWVSPTRRLYDLFWAIHSMKEQTPPEVVALSAKHEVVFLPPPA
jgi:hypothetical protein